MDLEAADRSVQETWHASGAIREGSAAYVASPDSQQVPEEPEVACPEEVER